MAISIAIPGGAAKATNAASKASKISQSIARNKAWQEGLRNGQQQIIKVDKSIDRAADAKKAADAVKKAESEGLKLIKPNTPRQGSRPQTG